MRTRGRGQSSLLLLDVVDLLTRMNIPYAVIGAFAVSFYGILRASLDADLVISLTGVDEDVESLVVALSDAGFLAQHRGGDADDPIRNVIKEH